MLVIRKKQIQEFIATNDDQLAKVVAEAVREANGDRVAEYDDSELARMARIGIDRARSRGLFNAEDIAAFVAIMFEIAPRFDEQPEIDAAFKDARLPPELRFKMLFQMVPDAAWAEAGKRYDDSFWFPDRSGK
jgi:hypothetical protein